MAKKLVKKRKLKIFNFLLFLLILGVISFGIYCYVQIPIKNIIIKNTTYLNDDYILDLAKIKNYPKYYKYSNRKIIKNIKTSDYVENVKVKRSFFHTIEIEVDEKKPLYYRDSDKRIVFSDNSTVEQDNDFVLFRVPRLLNYVPNNISKNFIKGMNNIKEDTLSKISDILYDPNEIDKERFLLYMDDGNMVYLTLTKFKMINYYNEVLEQLEDKKGILYLDNGNHFKIRG